MNSTKESNEAQQNCTYINHYQNNREARGNTSIIFRDFSIQNHKNYRNEIRKKMYQDKKRITEQEKEPYPRKKKKKKNQITCFKQTYEET